MEWMNVLALIAVVASTLAIVAVLVKDNMKKDGENLEDLWEKSNMSHLAQKSAEYRNEYYAMKQLQSILTIKRCIILFSIITIISLFVSCDAMGII